MPTHDFCSFDKLGAGEGDSLIDLRQKFLYKKAEIKAECNTEDDQLKKEIEVNDSFNLLKDPIRRALYMPFKSEPILGWRKANVNSREMDKFPSQNVEILEFDTDESNEDNVEDLRSHLSEMTLKLENCEEDLARTKKAFQRKVLEKNRELEVLRQMLSQVQKKTGGGTTGYPLICKYPGCGVIFQHQSAESRHRRTAHSSVTYDCPKCSYYAGRKDTLVVHMKAVHRSTPKEIKQIKDRRQKRRKMSPSQSSDESGHEM